MIGVWSEERSEGKFSKEYWSAPVFMIAMSSMSG